MFRSALLLVTAACFVGPGTILAQEPTRFPIAKTPIVNRRGPYGQIQPNVLSLLAEPDVRSELKLSEEQRRKVDDNLVRQQQQSSAPGTLRKLQGLNAEERRQLLEKQSRESSKASSEVEETLKHTQTESQRARLDQLLIQVQGVLVVVRSDIAEPLGMTDEQKKKLRNINMSAPQPPPLDELGKMTDDERRKALDEWVAASNERQVEMLGALDDEQKTRFAKIRGEPFAFPATQIGANVGKILGNER